MVCLLLRNRARKKKLLFSLSQKKDTKIFDEMTGKDASMSLTSLGRVPENVTSCGRKWTATRLHVSCPNRTSARIPRFPHLSSLPVKKKLEALSNQSSAKKPHPPNPNRRQRELDRVPLVPRHLPGSSLIARAGLHPQTSPLPPPRSTKMAGDKMDIVDSNDEHSIKPAPEKASAVPDTTDWPLLLKNYSELAIRTSHFTPIPHGSAPFKRDIKSYVSSGVINLVSLPGEDERVNSRWENALGYSEEDQC